MIKSISQKRPVDIILVFLLIFASIYIAGNIGTGSLTNWDEAVYANVAREIVRTGDLIRLQDRGQPWLDKPPLYMWSTSLFYRMLGVNEFTSRITSSLFAVLTISLLYIFLKQVTSWQSALIGSLTLLGLPHYLHFSKMGMLDPTLTFFIVLVIYLFWKGQDDHRYLFFAGLFVGFGYLTKGSASFLSVAILLLFCLVTKQMRLLFRKEFLFGFSISLLIIVLWYVAQYFSIGQGSLKGYFENHILGRMMHAKDSHTGGLNFYQKAIFNKNMPWSIFTFASFLYVVIRAIKKPDKFSLLIICWVAATYCIFSAIQTKLHWYIIPIYPALAISFGLFAEKFLKGSRSRIAIIVILIGLALQVPYSWAFRLSFSREVKDTASFAHVLQKQGSKVYVYKCNDEKEYFYFGDFPSLSAINKPSNGSIYCIVDKKELSEFKGLYNFEVTSTFDNYLVVKLL